jgi:two-component system sensor histidine kinase KdpD
MRVAAIAALVVVASLVLRACDADMASAALALLAVTAGAASFGRTEGACAVLGSYLALNLWFTNPTGTLGVDKIEDLLPLVAFTVAALVCSMPSARLDVRPVLAVLGVAAAAALLEGTDADLAVAALVLLGVVVVTAAMGVPSAVTAVAGSYLALNFWFTPPIGSLEITKGQDLVPLLAFIAAAAASAATVERIKWLGRRAAFVEREAFDARVAQVTSDSRAEFLASMTHNLRTPLATIKASLSALLASPDDDAERRRTLLRGAKGETDRLERLVTKVLELARIHAHALQPSMEPVDLTELVGRAARRLDALADERGVHVDFVGDALILASVDPDMLELVVVVMLENAVRYAPAGSRIAVAVDGLPSGRARIRVADHGPGIPAAQRDAVFGEFVQLERDGVGSGLGLTIARSMVEAHDGRIWIEETPGGGATVIVTLPGGTEEVEA